MKDLNLTITTALPGVDGTVTTTDFDLGCAAPSPTLRETELVIEVPALTSTHLPSSKTLTITVQSGETATPSTTTNLVKVITGTGSTIAAQDVKFYLPSGTGRYVNVKFVGAGGTGSMTAISAITSLRPRLLK